MTAAASPVVETTGRQGYEYGGLVIDSLKNSVI